jgi:hypothetical protein
MVIAVAPNQWPTCPHLHGRHGPGARVEIDMIVRRRGPPQR